MSEFIKKTAATAAALSIGSGATAPAIEAGTVAPDQPVQPHEQTLLTQEVSQAAQFGRQVLRAAATSTRSHQKPKLHFTGYQVAGPTSTFGPPTEAAGQTADGGNDAHPCIALRNDSTLDHKFQITILYHHIKHQAVVPQCDWGPAAYLGRTMDVDGYAVEELQPALSPANYPTGAWGIAREISNPTKKATLRHVQRKSGMLTVSALGRQ